MVSFAKLIQGGDGEKRRRPKKPRGEAPKRKSRRQAAPPAAPTAPAPEPTGVEVLPVSTRAPVPPPEAILGSLIPPDAGSRRAIVEPAGEEIPASRPAPPPPPEAEAEAQIPVDMPTGADVPEAAEEIPSDRRAHVAPLEAIAEEEIPSDLPGVPPRLALDSISLFREPTPSPAPAPAPAPEARDIEQGVSQVVPLASTVDADLPRATGAGAGAGAGGGPEAPAPIVDAARMAQDAPDVELVPSEGAARVEGPPPVPADFNWGDDDPRPEEDGLSELQRSLVGEVKSILAEVAPLAVSEPEAQPAAVAILEAPPAPVGIAARVEEAPAVVIPAAEADLTPEQEVLLMEVRQILDDLGIAPGREEESPPEPAEPEPQPAARDDRIEDVSPSLPGTEPAEIPVEQASAPPELGEILGVVRSDLAAAMADLDERAELAEAISPSPPAPEGLESSSPPALDALLAAPPSEAEGPPVDSAAAQEAFAPPDATAPAADAPPASAGVAPTPSAAEVPPSPVEGGPAAPEILSFPPPMRTDEEEPSPVRRRPPSDPFAALRGRGKDVLDALIFLVGLAWLAGGLLTGDGLSWVIALLFLAVPGVDLYVRTRPRRPDSA